MDTPQRSHLVETLRDILRKDYWLFAFRRRAWLRNTLIALLGSLTLVSLCGYYYVYYYSADLEPILRLNKVDNPDYKKASYVYASDGKVIGRFFQEIRDPVKLSEVPKLLQQGFIAAEDKNFYDHSGIDLFAIARAAFHNALRKAKIIYAPLSGASTIPQQYVRLAYSEEVPEFKVREKSISRKLKEARIAIQVVKNNSRDKILENFLNLIYFGHGVNGVAEAARFYFGKDLRWDSLTLQEVAILVSLNKSASLYCPIFHASKSSDEAAEIIRIAGARDRYNWVLWRMLSDGYITRAEYEKALFKKNEPMQLDFVKVHPLQDADYGYGNRLVKEFLLTNGHDEKELSELGGLRIYTTIDSRMQKIVTEEFEKHLALVNRGKVGAERLNGAFVVIEVATGNILALSGGSDFNESQYNRVMASRSPGSGFKPFTYAAAMEYAQMGFFSQICNCPFQMRGGRPGEIWAPQNFKEENPVPTGYIDLSIGLIRSVNLATLNLAHSIGIKRVIKMAHLTGVWGNPGIVRNSDGHIWLRRPGYQIEDGLAPYLPTAIGASDVNLLELANAYAVFFREGVYIQPTLIQEVKNTSGQPLPESPKARQTKRVFSQATSLRMLALMRAVTKIGTAKISMRDIRQQVAVKTGTSNGPRDLSMFGGTPELVLAIRIGRDDYKPIELRKYMKKVSGDSNMQVSGGWVAGPLFRKIIDRIYADRQVSVFDPAIEMLLAELLSNYAY